VSALALRCACGAVTGRLLAPERATRAVCYCRDCRAYARWLGQPERLLDAAGGTDVVASTPARVRIERGVAQLACVSLAPNGLFRWYTACCRSAIGSLPRNPKLPYVGLARACLDAPAEAIAAAIGPPVMKVGTDSALRPVAPAALPTLRGAARIAREVAIARLGGAWRDSPFFRPGSREPIARPKVLQPDEREALDDPD
jgi:hypothetical protein